MIADINEDVLSRELPTVYVERIAEGKLAKSRFRVVTGHASRAGPTGHG
jgi:hypothetical protein